MSIQHTHKESSKPEFEVQKELESMLKKQYGSMLMNMNKEIIFKLSKEIKGDKQS